VTSLNFTGLIFELEYNFPHLTTKPFTLLSIDPFVWAMFLLYKIAMSSFLENKLLK